MTPDPSKPVTDDELHAFVDGQLDPARLPAVVAWLNGRPDDAARVAAWQAQRLALRQVHRATELGPTPDALTRVVLRPRARAGWAVAAAVLMFVVGAGGGLVAGRLGVGSPAVPTSGIAMAFARDAAMAHAVYSPESRHPVEVGASDERHLVQWLSRRLGAPLKAPDLQGRGFALLGGRLLPGAGSPRAQFMYEDAGGRRVTLYLTVFDASDTPDETAFRRLRTGAVESFYWVERRFGYALTGELPPAEMQALARDVYRQMDR